MCAFFGPESLQAGAAVKGLSAMFVPEFEPLCTSGTSHGPEPDIFCSGGQELMLALSFGSACPQSSLADRASLTGAFR